MSLLDDIIGTKIVSGLLDRRRPLVDANPLQGFYDSAPAGSVMAPGGLLANPMSTPIGSTPGATQDMLGLLSFAPIVGDAAGLAADAQMYANQPETRTLGNYALSALGALPFVPSVAGATVFHGSPHQFDAFDLSKIGTGEGAQAYGHGLYFAENPNVAKSYQMNLANGYFSQTQYDEAIKKLSKARDAEIDEWRTLHKKTKAELPSNNVADNAPEWERWLFSGPSQTKKGSAGYSLQEIEKKIDELEAINISEQAVGNLKGGAFYTVDLPDSAIDKMLDWDAPLSEQPEGVREAIASLKSNLPENAEADLDGNWDLLFGDDVTGQDLLGTLASITGNPASGAESLLHQAGIPGIKYFDGDSRAAGEGTRNYVVFDDQLPRILRRE